MKLSLTKAHIKAVLLALTSTTQRKLVVSAIVAVLAAVGVREVAPETIDNWIVMTVTVAQTFITL